MKNMKIVYVACETCDFTVIFASDKRTFFFCKKDKIGLNFPTDTKEVYSCFECNQQLERYDLADEDNTCPICNSFLSVMYGQEQFSEKKREMLLLEIKDNLNKKKLKVQKYSEADIDRLIKPAFDPDSSPERRESAIRLLELTKTVSPKQITELRSSMRSKTESSTAPNYTIWAFTFLGLFMPFLIIYAGSNIGKIDLNLIIYAFILLAIIAVFLASYVQRFWSRLLSRK
jgi:hypothetical protein